MKTPRSDEYRRLKDAADARRSELRKEADKVWKSEGWEGKLHTAARLMQMEHTEEILRKYQAALRKHKAVVGKKVWTPRITRYGYKIDPYRSPTLGVIEVFGPDSKVPANTHRRDYRTGYLVVRILRGDGTPSLRIDDNPTRSRWDRSTGGKTLRYGKWYIGEPPEDYRKWALDEAKARRG
jgi:hypothetical protein